jgi:ribonuclease BN (tRNA processing enzyme)
LDDVVARRQKHLALFIARELASQTHLHLDHLEGLRFLLHDSQFTEEEYVQRVGWGHSSVAHAVGFARKADVGRLVLFHHDPDRSDAGVDRLTERASELWDGDGGAPPLAAREGMTIELG